MAHTPPLLLRHPNLLERMTTLFADLNDNPTLQEAFIKSPDKVIGEGALPRAAVSEQVSVVNEFIFSALANEGLQRWFQGYRNDIDKRHYPDEQKLLDLARA